MGIDNLVFILQALRGSQEIEMAVHEAQEAIRTKESPLQQQK